MFKVKKYPFNEYTDWNGTSIGFAYKCDENDMINDPYSNGFFHYAYFEDKCMESIRWSGLINPNFFRKEILGSSEITNIDLFIHNLLHPSRKRRIHIIRPIKGYYDKQRFICYSNLFSHRYRTIVIGEDMKMDTVSLHCTGTRAYETLLAKVNDIKEGTKISAGRVLIIPNYLLCECDNKNIYRLMRKETRFNRFVGLDKFNEYTKNPDNNPTEGELFLIKTTNGAKFGYIYMRGEYVKLHV